MQMPSQAQINTAGRYAGAIAGTAFTIFGLQAKGISLDQVKLAISELGSVANDIILFTGTAVTLYGSIKGVLSSSSKGQAASIGANPSMIVEPAPNGTATVTITDPAAASAAIVAQQKAAA
jgi:hypothetical protein